MATELYLIRHGESLGNREKRFLGHTDWDLTERGYMQAKCAASFFSDIAVDAVYASDLMRAFHTAKAIADTKGLTVTPEKGLREIFAGDWERMKYDDISQTYPELWKNWQNANTPDIETTNGERVSQLLDRVYDTLLRIAKKHDKQSVVIGLHATPIRVMINKISGRELDSLCDTPWVANASVTKLIFENGVFSIAFVNECTHLGTIKTVLPSGV